MVKRPKMKPTDLLKNTRLFDEEAETMSEIAKTLGMDRNMAYIIRDQMLSDGLWEEVFKHSAGGRVTKAYRLTRKGRASAKLKAEGIAND